MAAWRTSTRKQYQIYIKKWMEFCSERDTDPLHTTPVIVLEFFTSLFQKVGYSALNTARAALSSLVLLSDGYSIGNHPIILRFFKGAFNLKPPRPRYERVWDVKDVFTFLRKLSPARALTLKDLTLKTCMLLALVSAQRRQTLHKLTITEMDLHVNKVIFYVSDLLKTSKPGHMGLKLEFQAYPPDRRLCVYTYVIEYLKRTRKIRGKETNFFISFKKPYGKVGTDTIARWIKTIMSRSGINLQLFSAHSTRAAAVSKVATQTDFPVAQILAQAGWRSEQTFQRYYNKPVNCASSRFMEVLLKK